MDIYTDNKKPVGYQAAKIKITANTNVYADKQQWAKLSPHTQ